MAASAEPNSPSRKLSSQVSPEGGFGSNTAAQFGAALIELKNNVADHSMAIETGVLYFCGGNRWFEFGVTDRSQGVLASFKAFRTTQISLITATRFASLYLKAVPAMGPGLGTGTGFVRSF